MSPENDHKYTLPSFNFSEIDSTIAFELNDGNLHL